MDASLLVVLTVAVAGAEHAADELWVLGATGIELRDGGPGLAVLHAGFPTREAARSAASSMARTYPVDVIEIDDAQWRDAWREFAEPVAVGSLLIAPAWRPVDIDGGRRVVQIEPGRCFGSGSHPTTRLLLDQIEVRLHPGDRVLDVGSGSGILAVTAALLGAGRVTAIDVDPEAVVVTRANAARNGVHEVVVAASTGIDSVTGTFDLVVANLSAAVLAELCRPLVAALAPAGLLAVSGMLAGQWRHVAGRFADLTVVDLPELEGWVGAVMRHGGP